MSRKGLLTLSDHLIEGTSRRTPWQGWHRGLAPPDPRAALALHRRATVSTPGYVGAGLASPDPRAAHRGLAPPEPPAALALHRRATVSTPGYVGVGLELLRPSQSGAVPLPPESLPIPKICERIARAAGAAVSAPKPPLSKVTATTYLGLG